MSDPHILVVDDEPDIRGLLQEILEDEGYEISVAKNAQQAREARRARRPDLILLDIWMPDTDGISLLKEWSDNNRQEVPVIMMSGHGNVETAVESTRLGAYDYIEKPLSIAKLLLTISHALETATLLQENTGLKRHSLQISEPVGKSMLIQNLRDQAERIAQHNTPVFLTGESGVGKTLFAHYIHSRGQRASGPFGEFNVAGATAAGAANDLFGYEQGDKVHFGHLERANGGTLFIKDVADMDLDIQAKLLSALQSQSLTRSGGMESVSINVRIIVATTQDLQVMVDRGQFREDLFYHLNVVPMHIPPLREHLEDIPELLEFYVNLLCEHDAMPYRRFSVAAQNELRNHSWPGNTRELKNLVQRLLILGNSDTIEIEELDQIFSGTRQADRRAADHILDMSLREAREQFERDYLMHQLQVFDGSVSKVAEQSGLERTHLYRKLKSLGIDPKTAKHRT